MDGKNTYTHDKWFRRAIKELDLNTSEQALYYTLREFWNINKWGDKFSLWDEDVEKAMNVVHNTMKKAREGCLTKAAAHGCTLFNFMPGIGRGKKGKYVMIPYLKELNTDSFIDSFTDALVNIGNENMHDTGSDNAVKESFTESGVTAYIKTVNTETPKEEKKLFNNNNDNKTEAIFFGKDGEAAAQPVDDFAHLGTPTPVAAVPSQNNMQWLLPYDANMEYDLEECLRLFLELQLPAKDKIIQLNPSKARELKIYGDAFNIRLALGNMETRRLDDWCKHFGGWIVKYTIEQTVHQTTAKKQQQPQVTPEQAKIPEPGEAKINNTITFPVPNSSEININQSSAYHINLRNFLECKHPYSNDRQRFFEIMTYKQLDSYGEEFNNTLPTYNWKKPRMSFNYWTQQFIIYVDKKIESSKMTG